jgi:C1A family cysteine protease
MVARLDQLGTGWVPDPPDPRDYRPTDEALRPLLERTGITAALRRRPRLPTRVDLRPWCGPVWFQGGFNTCSAHVVAALLAFYEKKAFGKAVEPSRLFLYRVAKNFLRNDDPAGVFIRQTMGVLRLIGAPPEKYWPYPDPGTIHAPRNADPRMEAEPGSFCYALAAEFQAVSYYRLDEARGADRRRPTAGGATLLRQVKAHLAAQMPMSLGFPLYPSLTQATKSGRIPYPARGEARLGNHAVIAVGYDDRVRIRNAKSKGGPTVGALLVQNSWSKEWGEDGFGWLPYEFVLRGKTQDFWTLSRAEWVDTGVFQLDV